MKTIKQILLTIAVLLCSLTANAYDFEVDGIRYDIISFTELTVKATSVSESIISDLIIPSKVLFNGKELNVIELGDEFAISNLVISSLTISDGIKSVGDRAFKNCSNLATITIAQTISEIGTECFYGCTALEIFENTGIITLGSKSFAGCENLEMVSIENIMSIEEGTFQNCVKLVDCYFPNIISIGKESFKNCQSLDEYDITNNVLSIDDFAFKGCINLSSIVIPNSVRDLGKGIFEGCTSLTSISIGSGVSFLPWIFEGCVGLSDIRIEDSYETLIFDYTGERSYSSNYNDNYVKERRSMYYPSSAMFIDMDLKTVYIGRNLTTQSYCYKQYYQSGAYLLENYYYVPNPPFSGSNIESLTIGNLVSDLKMYTYVETNIPEVAAIGTWNGAFQNCTNLDTVILYSSTTLIPKNTFSGCDKISTIEIPNSVKKIAVNAFEGCTGLKTLSLGCGLETIEANALSGCDSLVEINIKAPVPPTYNTGFSSNHYINTNVNVPADCLNIYQETEPWKNFWNLLPSNNLISLFEIDGIKYSEIKNKNVEIIGNNISEQTELILNNEVEYYGNKYNVMSISDNAFKNCSYLSSIQILYGIESIGKSAFEDCANLEVANLSSNIHSIGDAAFKNCSLLGNIILPDSITIIPSECFYGCQTLNSITNLSSNIHSIGSAAFKNCSLLDNVILPNSITVIPSECFYECKSLSSMVIPSSVVKFEKAAFEGCSNLKEFIFEDGEKPLLFSNGEYDMSTNMQSTVIDGVTVKFKIKYYSAYFADLPIEKLYVGRNLSNESRYIIEIDEAWDGWSGYYYYYYYYLITSYDAPFSKLPSLKELIIGENVDILGPAQELIPEVNMYITSGSFKNCSSIQTIEVKNSTPPAGAEFANNVYSNAKLIVPMSSINLYEEAEPWKNFVNLMKFNITYIVDNDVYFIDTIATGDTIVLIDEPTKEGHTFSGWSEAPETMPAEDITITGSFSVNSYTITYIVDGEVYATEELTYGSEIVLIDEPTKEGYTFSGWSEAPETMPAEDITITGSFSVNSYTITYIVDGEVYATEELTYGSEIVLIDEPTKEGYTFSGWSEAPETMPAEDIEITGSFIPTENVSEVEFDTNIQTTNNGIILLNANNNWVRVYTINGILVKKIDNYTGEEITLNKGVYIVSVGNKAIKIML